jgi:signal transduction histidine kinase
VLPDPESGGAGLDKELETTVYRLIQEGLTNVAKHASASAARVSVGIKDGEILVEVEDDGEGFDTNAQASGFGLAGMRERVYLASGTLELESDEGGTAMRARLPAKAQPPTMMSSGEAGDAAHVINPPTRLTSP